MKLLILTGQRNGEITPLTGQDRNENCIGRLRQGSSRRTRRLPSLSATLEFLTIPQCTDLGSMSFAGIHFGHWKGVIMQKVDEYLRRARYVGEDAAKAKDVALKAGLETLARGWSLLAQERLALVQERLNQGELGGWDPDPKDAA